MTPENIENLFQSIDTIVNARIANLPYDQTIECEIIKKENDDKYLVQYQASTFTAISKESFEPKDIVYVQIPQGDFTQDKFIINKKQKEEIKVIKKLPFLSFVKDGNLFNDTISTKEYSISTTSGDSETITSIASLYSFYNNAQYAAGYTRLGVKVSIKTEMTYEMVSGDYGVRLLVTGFDQTKTFLPFNTANLPDNGLRETRTFNLSIKDMIGSNFYNTLGYCNQEKVFDITNFVITNIQFQIWQDGKFRDINNTRINGQKIYFSNFSLYFGYDISDFYNTNYKTYLYTNSGLQYNGEYHTKPLFVRFVQSINNNLNDLSTVANDSTAYSIHWEEYDPNVVTEAPYSKLLAYDSIAGTSNYKNQVLSTARNRLKHSYVVTVQNTIDGKLYTSNTLDFTNTAYLEGSQLLDLLTGFQAEFVEESGDYNGRFFIYGQDSTSTNKIVSSNIHYINLSYIPASSADTASGFQLGDEITWIIPAINTMIEPVYGAEYGIDPPTYDDDLKTYTMTKVITDLSVDIDVSERRFKVPYKIKDYYSNFFTNNNIIFQLKRDENIFTTNKELLFGTSGSQGNEYNIVIKIQNTITQEYVNAIPFTDNQTVYRPRLFIYDYDNKLIDGESLSKTFSNIRWEIQYDQNNSTGKFDRVLIEESEYGFKIHDRVSDIILFKPALLVYTMNIGDKILKSVLPIALCANAGYKAISGTTVITYDITGKKPVYTKTPFQLDNLPNKEDSDSNNSVTWDIHNFDSNTPSWAPKIIKNCLVAPSIFHKDSEKPQFSLTAKINNNIVWIQPIYMHQNKYPIGYEQPELNPLSFGDKTVVNTLVGKLKGENTGKVSGIVMGDILTDNIETLGLYAYHDNTEFFCIDENGYVFLNGQNDDESETGGVNISNSIIGDSTLSNSIIEDSTLNNITLTGTLSGTPTATGTIAIRYNNENIFSLTTNGNAIFKGTVTATSFTGNATSATTATSATNAANYTNNGNIYTNLTRIKTAIENLGGTYNIA